MPDHNYFANLIWQIADLLRGPYRPPQYERVMLPMTVLRRFDCVLAPTKSKVLAEHARRQGGRLNDDALDRILNNAAGQRFHNHSPLDFVKLKGDPDHIEAHLVNYTQRDPDTKPVATGGRDEGYEPDAALRDFENVPLKDDIDAYFEREVRPHVPDAWMDRSKDKVGYEINFNRHFYKYTPPRPLEEIDADLKKAEEEIMRLLREVTE